MAILKRIIQNNKRSCYFYNGSVVFSTIMCVSRRLLIVVVFPCIKFLNILHILLKYYLNIGITSVRTTRNTHATHNTRATGYITQYLRL
jgi:hypothetical protein